MKIHWTMYRSAPHQNIWRWYNVQVDQDIWNRWQVICAWGRYGRHGQQRCVLSEVSQATAMETAQNIIRQKQQRGYRTPLNPAD
jgi:predicted DNA-binding WGR domain protein